MSQLQRVMIANALLVMLVSMFAGFMLMFNLIGGFEILPGKILEFSVYGTTEGWVRAHTGGLTNALLVMGIAFALPHINVSEFQEKFLAYGFIYVAWSFTVFYWLGNASANRALTFGDNQMGESSLISVLGFLPGLPSVVLVVVLLIIAARGILSEKDQ
ncbi:isomerase [Gammaproteobacteria bacterium]|nr:isomerase [Gammaproteobacteria bacterium]